jgi:1,4-dihydroxy-2-naphthoate octaprenyltransferase
VTTSRLKLWSGAFTGFYRPGLQEVRTLDAVSRFLFAARSVILVISAQAAIIAGLLAADAGKFAWGRFVLVLVGFVVAHMISNLSNDYFGFKRGHDTPDSPRMRYTVHPLASGVLSTTVLVTGLVILGIIGLSITAWFVAERGWLAVFFAVAGIAALWLYDAAPTPLKAIGLGEAACLVVWGPLMVGGGYAMITGEISLVSMIASIPYGLTVMTILNGKHIDQMPFDSGRGIRTLPVIIGARAAEWVNVVAIVAMYVIVAGLILAGSLSFTTALVVVAVPKAIAAIRRMSQPRPESPPPGFVGWPLWFHRVCLEHSRVFGWAYIGGLALGAMAHGLAAR